MSENNENTLLIESKKWKKFEDDVLLMISNCKTNCKREAELIKTLEHKVDDLSQSKSELTEKIKSEVYNKYFSSHDIFKLDEELDQINISCNGVKTLLETCNKLQQKSKNHLEKYRHKLQQHNNEDILSSQNHIILNLKSEMRNCAETLAIEQENQSLKLHRTGKLQEDATNNLKLILENNQQLENNLIVYKNELRNLEDDKRTIYSAKNENGEIKESILTSIANLEAGTDQKIKVVNENIEILLKEYEDVNLSIEECKKMFEEVECNNGYLLEENIKLAFESKSIQEKLADLDESKAKEETEFSENAMKLKDSNNCLNINIQNKEKKLLEEKEKERAYYHAEENYKSNIEKHMETIQNLQSNLNRLYTEKNNLIKLTNNKKELIGTYSKTYEENNVLIQSLKSSIQELNTTISSSALEHKNTTEQLLKEIQDCNSNINLRNNKLEAMRLTHCTEIDAAQSDEITNFNKEVKQLEDSLSDVRKLTEKMEEEKKQILVNLEGKILECDILSKKIKTAEEVQNSLKEELTPKSAVNKCSFVKRQHIDETSESSFDGNVTFHQRMLMRKKVKRSKTQPTEMTN